MRKAAFTVTIVVLLMQTHNLSLAQQTITLDRETPDHVFAPLDKSFITTGILHDKVFNFSRIEKYDGITDTIIDFANWRQLYYELYRASVSSPAIPSPGQVDTMTENVHATAAVPVAIMNMKYNNIKPYALDSDLLELRDGQLYDVPGREESPYEEKTVFAAAVMTDRIGDGAKTFYFGSDFYFSNDATAPVSIEFDFDDGQGFQSVDFGQAVTVNYAPVAGKTESNLRIRITYADGRILSGNITTASAACPSAPDLPPAQWPSGSPHIYDFTATLPYLGQAASGHAYFKYSFDGVFDKPFILVEGIDFGRNRHEDIANGDLGYCGLFEFAGDDVDRYFFLRHYKELINDLRSNGYDLILLDFRDGADYIQRNSMLLVELINRVNSYLPSCEPIIVAGASMGGQVGRYALAYMEQNGMKHNARMYISMDSPHQGASIPYGLQRMFRWLAEDVGKDEARVKLENTLRRPASKQLLVYQGTAPGGVNDFRIPYTNELAALGYPQKIRRVGIANGSRNAVGMGFNPGDRLLEYTCSKFIPGVVVRFDVYAVPGGKSGKQSNVVFEGKFTDTGPLRTWKILDVFLGPATPWDNCPGGMRNTVEETVMELNPVLEKEGCPAVKSTHFRPNHSFIPTISALDINTGDLFINVEAHVGDLQNPAIGTTPFQAIHAPFSNNEQHSEATIGNLGNIQFVLDEVYAGENKLISPLTNSSPNTGVFNYGDLRRWLLPGVIVQDGGRLHINADLPADYGTGILPPSGSTFTVETYNCGSVVEIRSSGQLIVGETTPNNKGIVRFRDASALIIDNGGTVIVNPNSRIIIEAGATLELKAGSTLIIEDNASVTVQPGATFTYEQGAIIELRGPNAKLELQDQNFTIDNGLQFITDKASAATGGFVLFSQNSTLEIVNGAVINNGTSVVIDKTSALVYHPASEIQLNGDEAMLGISGRLDIKPSATFTFTSPTGPGGFVRFNTAFPITADATSFIDLKGAGPTDKILEITGGFVQPPDHLSRFLLRNGRTEVTSDYIGLDLGCPYSVINATINGRQFNMYGQASSVIAGSALNCRLSGMLSYYGNRLTVVNSTVTNGGIFTDGVGVNFTDVTFTNNDIGWTAQGASGTSFLRNCTFTANGFNGISVTISPDATVLLDNCTLTGNGTDPGVFFPLTGNGVYMEEGTLTPRCTQISGNTFTGVYIGQNAALNMSTFSGGGYADLGGNPLAVFLDHADDIYLNGGYNNFTSDNIITIEGTLNKEFDAMIDAANNQWDTPNLTTPLTNAYYFITGIPRRPRAKGETPATEAQITLVDNIPQLPVACGSKDPDTGDPCRLAQPVCNADPLLSCDGCKKITTEDFQKVKTNDAVRIAIANMETTDSTKNDLVAINQFHQILTWPEGKNSTTDALWVQNLAYRKIKEALSNAFITGRIPRGSPSAPLHPSVEQVLEVQDSLITRAQRDDNNTEEFYLTTDKGHTYRLANHHEDALKIIDALSACLALSPSQDAYLQRTKRFLLAEHLVLSGQVPRESFDSLLRQNIGSLIPPGGIAAGGSPATDSLPAGQAGLPGVFCTGDTIRFLAGDFAESYVWDFADGQTASGKETVHVYNAPGTYCVKLIQDFSCGTTERTITVTILPRLETGLEEPEIAACDNTGLTMALAVHSGFAGLAPPDTTGGCGYTPLDTSMVRVLNTWSFSGNCPDTTTTGFTDAQSCSFSAGGEFIVSVQTTVQFLDTATNTWITTLCSNTLSDTVVIPEALEASFTFEPFDCIRDSIRFINTTAGGSPDSLLLFAWNFGDGEESDQRDPAHLYEEAGSYTVTLIGGNALTSCIDTFVTDITVPLCPFGVVFNNTACGGGPAPGVTIVPAFVIDGDTVISENEDFAALTDENGVFFYSAETLEEIADESEGGPVSFATVSGLDFEDAEFKTIAEWLDDAPGEFTLAAHNLDWAARYGDLPAPGATQDTIRMRVATAIDANRNVYVTGFAGTDPGLSVGSFGFVTIKYSPRGEVLWASELAPDVSSGRGAVPLAIAVNSLGEAYVAGFLSETSGQSEMLVVKYDTLGNQTAAESFSAGSGVNQAVAIALDAAGNIYVTGEGAEDIITIKYDADLDEQWSASYDGPGGGRDAANAIAIGNGSVYVAGVSTGAGTGSDMVTIKYSDNGDEEWDERYNGSANLADGAVDVGTDPEGNVFVTGISAETGTGFGITTIKYNDEGDMLWNKHFRTPGNDFDQPRGLATDNSGNVYIAGVTGTGLSLLPTNTLQVDAAAFDFDVVTLKYDADGGLLWDETYDGPIAGDLDVPNDIIADAAGNVYVTGVTQGPSDNNSAFSFGFGVETTFINIIVGGSGWITLTIVPEPPVSVGSGPGDNILTIRYDTDGNMVWGESFDSPEGAQDGAFGIALDEAGDVYVTGFSALLNPGPFSVGVRFTTLKYAQCDDISVAGAAKTAGPPPIVTEKKEPAAQELEKLIGTSLVIYPNPAKDGTINVAFRLEKDEVVTFEIMDMSGRVMVMVAQDAPMKEGTYVIPVSTTSLHSGLYLARLRTGTASAVQRIAIMR